MDEEAQIEVTKLDLPFLEHNSFVSVSRPIRLTTMELNVLETAPHRRKGVVPALIREKIKAAATRSVTLTGIDKELIKNNL